MFGISFSELLLVGLVALLVLGPERLPGAARTAGLWIGRLKRSVNTIKMDIERELGTDFISGQLHSEPLAPLARQAARTHDPISPDVPSPAASMPLVSEPARPESPQPQPPRPS